MSGEGTHFHMDSCVEEGSQSSSSPYYPDGTSENNSPNQQNYRQNHMNLTTPFRSSPHQQQAGPPATRTEVVCFGGPNLDLRLGSHQVSQYGPNPEQFHNSPVQQQVGPPATRTRVLCFGGPNLDSSLSSLQHSQYGPNLEQFHNSLNQQEAGPSTTRAGLFLPPFDVCFRSPDLDSRLSSPYLSQYGPCPEQFNYSLHQQQEGPPATRTEVVSFGGPNLDPRLSSLQHSEYGPYPEQFLNSLNQQEAQHSATRTGLLLPPLDICFRPPNLDSRSSSSQLYQYGPCPEQLHYSLHQQHVVPSATRTRLLLPPFVEHFMSPPNLDPRSSSSLQLSNYGPYPEQWHQFGNMEMRRKFGGPSYVDPPVVQNIGIGLGGNYILSTSNMISEYGLKYSSNLQLPLTWQPHQYMYYVSILTRVTTQEIQFQGLEGPGVGAFYHVGGSSSQTQHPSTQHPRFLNIHPTDLQPGSLFNPTGQGRGIPHLDGPIINTAYSPEYEAMNLPMDPHLRSWMAMQNRGNSDQQDSS